MTDNQENILRMYFTVCSICDANIEVWQSNEVFTSSYQKFKSKIPEIQKYIDLVKIEEIASNTFKSFDRFELEEMAYFLSGKLQHFATDTENHNLITVLHYNNTNLAHFSDNELIQSCTYLTSFIAENLDKLQIYEISTEELAEFQQLLSYFSAHSYFLKNNHKTKTTSDYLRKNLKEANEILKEKLDTEIQFFKHCAPDFFNLYQAAREVIKIDNEPIHTFTGKLLDYVN